MKNVFNQDVIKQTSFHIANHYASFNKTAFDEQACRNIESLELKQRSEQIFLALQQHLPEDFCAAKDILLATLRPVITNQDLTDITTDESGVAGWMILPYSQYIGVQGHSFLSEAMVALKQMTKRFSSEFGIRFLLLEQPQDTLSILADWVDDECHHVRRLISEGTRPLLPWAMQLPQIKADPLLVMPLLDSLRADASEYVRRSVANHLNDVAKTHPDFVANVATEWLAESNAVNRQRMVKHACRTLIKQGHPKVLQLLGYKQDVNVEVAVSLSNTQLRLGDSLEIKLSIINNEPTSQDLLIDYVVYHQKKNGQLTPKVFKWKSLKVQSGQTLEVTKSHAFKLISTRKYYSGTHQVSILVNGKEYKGVEFVLKVKG